MYSSTFVPDRNCLFCACAGPAQNSIVLWLLLWISDKRIIFMGDRWPTHPFSGPTQDKHHARWYNYIIESPYLLSRANSNVQSSVTRIPNRFSILQVLTHECATCNYAGNQPSVGTVRADIAAKRCPVFSRIISDINVFYCTSINTILSWTVVFWNSYIIL